MNRSEMTYREPEHEIPVVMHADVVVCGAGPAGGTAAIASARTGARTVLLELQGCLGGVWTAGMLTWIFEFDKAGIAQEIVQKLDECEARVGNNPQNFTYDTESMKLLLEEMCVETGVHMQIHTRVVQAIVDDGRMGGVITESKSGRQAWFAETFVDATGDGDLGALAGCGFDMGSEDGDFQPMTLMALMVNHEYGVSAIDAAQVTEATVRARAEIHRMVEALRSLGGVWESLQLVATAPHIGIREGRRIHGRYAVTVDDLRNSAQHEDAVCNVTFNVDVHSPSPKKGTTMVQTGVKVTGYDIPYRALVAKDVDGLLLAGRCISGDWLAHASYRVTGNSVALGQAAGVAAALSVEKNIAPHELAFEVLEKGLKVGTKVGSPMS